MYEIGSYGQSHDRQSDTRGTGCLLGYKPVLPYKEGCERMLDESGSNVVMERNEAGE